MKKKVNKKVISKKREEKVITPFNEMNDIEMNELFLELSNSSYWQAILKFNRIHHTNVMATLSSVDVFKEPTKAARAQGTDIGLFTLEVKIKNLIEKSK